MALRATPPPHDTIQDRLAAVGIVPDNGFEPIVFLSQGGKQSNHLLSEIGHRDPTSFTGELYASTGLFEQSGKDVKRDQAHLRAVTCMAFDCDLADYLGLEGDDRKALYSISIEELDGYLSAQRNLIRETFNKCNLVIHRLDVSGHGHHAYIYIDPQDRERIDDARATHKSLIAELNRAAGMQLADPKVSDTGTRVTRIPGSFNNKGAVPKLVRTIYYKPDQYSRLIIAATVPKALTPVAVPEIGSVLSVKDRQGIVSALQSSWTLGQKHNLGLAIAGAFARAGIPESETADVIAELSEGDERPDDRQKSVRDTYAKVRMGTAVQGYTGLRDYLPPAACDYVDGILTRYRKATIQTVDLPGGTIQVKVPTDGKRPESAPSQIKIHPLPEECFRGWIKQYWRLVSPLCASPDQFHLGVGLTLIGATMGRVVANRYVSKSIFPNTYCMLMGPAGTSAKDKAIELAFELPNAQGPRDDRGVPISLSAPFQLDTDASSAEGLVGRLAKHPNTLLYITEFQEMMIKAKRQGSAILPTLTKAWNAPPVLQNTTKHDNVEALNSSLSLIAAVQPGILSGIFTQSEIDSGFATRWLYFLGDGKANVSEDPPDIDERLAFKLYEELLDIRKGYADIAKKTGREVRINLNDEAKDYWSEWFHKDRQRPVQEDDERSMVSRLAVHARKAALTYAIADGAMEINADHIRAGTELVEWSWLHTIELMKTWGTTPWNELEIKIERVLKNSGPMSRRDLQNQCRSRRWGSREFSQVVRAMLENTTIESDKDGQLHWMA